MTHLLVSSLIGLNNTVTTLINDLYDAQIEEITLEMTNNTTLISNLQEEDWFAVVKAGDYSMLFGPTNPGKLVAFDKTLEESIEPLTSFMDEESTENFTNEISTIEQRISDITKHRADLVGDLNEVRKQTIIAMMISQWFSCLRWLEEADVLGSDESVVYVPSFVIDTTSPVKTIMLENNELSIVVNLDDASVWVRHRNVSAKDYIEVAMKDEGRDDVLYYINRGLDEISSLSKTLVDLV